MKYIFTLITLLSFTPVVFGEGYGPWQFDMPKEKVISFKEFGPYKPVEVTGGIETKNGVFNSQKTNISFTFAEDKLSKIQLWVYEGKSFDESLNSWMEVYDYLISNYGEVEFPDINSDQKLSRESIIEIFTKTMGHIPPVPEDVVTTIKFQMGPIKQPEGKIVYASYFNHSIHGFYVFLYAAAPY